MSESEQEHKERIALAASKGMNAMINELAPDGKLVPKDLLETLQFMIYGTTDSIDKCHIFTADGKPIVSPKVNV